jgi:hypothetical protein
MSITWSDVTALAPSLIAVSVAGQAQILATVALQVDSSNWGDLTDAGQLALARHLGSLALRPASGAGPVISETVGPVSRTFANLTAIGASLDSTPWGSEYARLRALLPCNFGFFA